MDEIENLEALSNILTEISANPYDLSLHVKHIELAKSDEMEEQEDSARQMFTAYWLAGDEVWLPLLEVKMCKGVDTLDEAKEMNELFEKAEDDYLCMSLLFHHDFRL